MGRAWIALAVVAAAAACSGGEAEPRSTRVASTGASPDASGADTSTTAPASAPGDTAAASSTAEPAGDAGPLAPDGPLHGVVMVSSLDAVASGVRPQAAFDAGSTEAIAIVSVDAERIEAPLVVEWYDPDATGARTLLFAHEIAGAPGRLAWSRGVSPRGMRPGVYEVVARAGDYSVSVPLVVRAPQPEGAAANPVEDWEVPQDGDSGWYTEPEGPLVDPYTTGPCTVQSVYAPINPIDVINVSTFWSGPCGTLTFSVAAAGGSVELFRRDVSADENHQESSRSVPVCSLPGGSDLPGTRLTGTASMSDGSTMSVETTLEDAGAAIVAGLETEPALGSVVSIGDTIDVSALGMVMSPALGIERLDVVAGGGALVASTPNLTGSSTPIECDPRRHYAGLRMQYVIPADAPPVIELCAMTRGFDGHEASECGELYLAEVWNGTMTLSFDGNITSGAEFPCRGTAAFTIQLDVRGSTVTGAGSITGPEFVCTVDGVEAPGLAPSGGFTVTGARNGDGFELLVLPDPGGTCCGAWPGEQFGRVVVPIVGPGRAETSFSSDRSMGQPWVGTLRVDAELTCSTCAGVS